MASRKTNAAGRPMEAGVKDDVARVLDSFRRCYYFMPPAGLFSRIGISDFVGLVEGLFFAIEVKRDEKPEPHIPQRMFLAAVRRAGGLALRIDSTNVHRLRDRIETHMMNYALRRPR